MGISIAFCLFWCSQFSCWSEVAIRLKFCNTHLVSCPANSDDAVWLHGIHTVGHQLVAVGTCGGDDALAIWDFLQLEAESSQAQDTPHRPAQDRP